MWGSARRRPGHAGGADEDFGIEAKFLSTPTQHHQMQGLLIEQDADNWIRFDTYRAAAICTSSRP